MISEENLLKILCVPHISEKVSFVLERKNTVVFIVSKSAKKEEIKIAVQKFFNVKVKAVNTLIVKGKIKNRGKFTGRRKDWKKAYISLEEGQHLNFNDNAKHRRFKE